MDLSICRRAIGEVPCIPMIILWPSRGFELRDNMVEHAIYHSSPKPMCQSYHVFLMRSASHIPPYLASTNNARICMNHHVMSRYRSCHCRLATNLIGTRCCCDFYDNLVLRHERPSYLSPASHISKCHQMKLVASDQLQVL